MKTKINVVVIALMALTLAFSACGSQEKKSNATEQVSKQTAYQCLCAGIDFREDQWLQGRLLLYTRIHYNVHVPGNNPQGGSSEV